MPREKFQNLTEPMFYTLLCLHRPAYGAEIMEQVAALTGGAVRLGPGTLYHLLEEFHAAGLITESDALGRRRTYRLTTKGEALLQNEYARLCRLADDYRRVFRPRGAAPGQDKEDEP